MSTPTPAPGPAWGPDVDLLHQALRDAERRAALLTELIEALSRSRDAQTLLQRSVESVVRAIAASGAFVYLWDEDSGRFVMRAATEGHQKAFIGRISLRPGEGLTGWSALMRRPVMIGEGLDRDPRVVVFPELLESEFRSCLIVPILVPGGDPVGVLSIYSLEESAFTDSDMRLVDEVAKLLASGIDRANLVDVWERQSGALESLIGVADGLPPDLRGCLSELAHRLMAIVPSEICVVEALDGDGGQADAVALAVRPPVAGPPEAAAGPEAGGLWSLSVAAARQLSRSLASTQGMTLPMRVAGRTVGMMTCYRATAYSDEDRALLAAVAGYGALALRGVAAQGSSTSALGQLVAARSDEEAAEILARCGWRPGTPVLPVVARCDPDLAQPTSRSVDSVVATVESMLARGRRRVLPAGSTVVAALLPVEERDAIVVQAERLAAEVAESLEDRGQAASVALGVGSPAESPLGVRDQLRSAVEASAWASLAPGAVRVRVAEEVERTRLLVEDLAGLLPAVDAYARLLQPVREHDDRHGTHLMETLAVLVEERGSVQHAAERLFIHRNTLRQRLTRIATLIGRPVEELDDWLAVALAVRISRG